MKDLSDEVIERAIEDATLDPYSSASPRFVVVADADALLSSVDNHCRTGCKPRLLRMAESSVSIVYAADHVYGEAYRGFRKLANRAASVEALRTCFEEHYLPVLRWVQTEANGTVDDRVALVTDETDVPTARLASLIAPCLVLSEDKALRRPGYAPDQWRLAAGHGAQVVEGHSMQQGAAMAIGLPVFAVVGGSVKLGRAAGLAWWTTVGLLGLGGYALLRSSERRKVIGESLWPVMRVIGDAMAEASARERAGIRGMKDVMFQPASNPSVKQQLATVLARSPRPMLATEIQVLIERDFEGPVPSTAVLREVLVASPEFTTPERYRWQLGRVSAAWSGVLSS